MTLYNQAKHTVEAKTPKEAKEIREAAETLNLELRYVKVKGKWEYPEDIEINRNAECQIEKIGRMWFYIKVAGDTVKCKPGHSKFDFLDRGTLKFYFD